MRSLLRGRAARGDHLIQLKQPLESICKAVWKAGHHLQSVAAPRIHVFISDAWERFHCQHATPFPVT